MWYRQILIDQVVKYMEIHVSMWTLNFKFAVRTANNFVVVCHGSGKHGAGPEKM